MLFAAILPELSKAEYDILRVLWRDGTLSVREVHDQVSPANQWAYSTTKTVMDRMVKKELLKREKFHGVFIYRPLISRPAGLARLVQFFADRVLETDYGTVVSLFARNKTLSQSEIDELTKLLHENEKKGGKGE